MTKKPLAESLILVSDVFTDLFIRSKAKKRFGEAFFSKANHFGSPICNMNVDRTVEQPTFWEFVQAVKENPGMVARWL